VILFPLPSLPLFPPPLWGRVRVGGGWTGQSGRRFSHTENLRRLERSVDGAAPLPSLPPLVGGGEGGGGIGANFPFFWKADWLFRPSPTGGGGLGWGDPFDLVPQLSRIGGVGGQDQIENNLGNNTSRADQEKSGRMIAALKMGPKMRRQRRPVIGHQDTPFALHPQQNLWICRPQRKIGRIPDPSEINWIQAASIVSLGSPP
jgi:hypothetical protein